jgi:flagellum-specific peptidoglycan hydrolase FlgJ
MLQYETSPTFCAIADEAVRAQATTKFPAKVMLAVWACESHWGANLTGDFNYWGITRPPEAGAARFCPTHEVLTEQQLAAFRPDELSTAIKIADLGNGRFRWSMSRWFASYASLEESVLAYTEFFTESTHRYQPAWLQFLVDHDEDGLLKRICAAGYATGDAEAVELAIEHQSNIVHAVEMAAAAANPQQG